MKHTPVKNNAATKIRMRLSDVLTDSDMLAPDTPQTQELAGKESCCFKKIITYNLHEIAKVTSACVDLTQVTFSGHSSKTAIDLSPLDKGRAMVHLQKTPDYGSKCVKLSGTRITNDMRFTASSISSLRTS